MDHNCEEAPHQVVESEAKKGPKKKKSKHHKGAKHAQGADCQQKGGPPKRPGHTMWEIQLELGWSPLDPGLQELVHEAEESGDTEVAYSRGVNSYAVDLEGMVQVNLLTGKRRKLRRTDKLADAGPSGAKGGKKGRGRGRGRGKGGLEDPFFGGLCGGLFGAGGSKGSHASGPAQREEATIAALPTRSERTARLVDRLLSSSVQVQLPADSSEEAAKLSPEEVEKVFVDNVPGVKEFLYREMHGQYSLEFMKGAYQEGLRAFRGTDMHNHLLWLMRLIVHHGHQGGSSAKRYLTEVAEAFMDCQAVQARVVERVGLEIRGVAPNFRGLVTSLVGDYKMMALKMLAAARLDIGLASDDNTPTHYENRLTADLGDLVGLNKDDIRRASLDEHAEARFRRLAKGPERERAAKHFRGLFDLDALVQAFVAEVNSFSSDSPPGSLARLFLDWASSRLKEKHVVFDEETCMSVDIARPLAMAVIEDLFLGQNGAPSDELYRGQFLRELFKPPEEVVDGEQPAEKIDVEDNSAGKHELQKKEEEDDDDEEVDHDEDEDEDDEDEGEEDEEEEEEEKEEEDHDEDEDDGDEEYAEAAMMGWLLAAEEANAEAQKQGELPEKPGRTTWQVELEFGWVRLEPGLQELVHEAQEAGDGAVTYQRGPDSYTIDLKNMVQINMLTGTQRKLRRTDAPAGAGLGGSSKGGKKGRGGGRGRGKGSMEALFGGFHGGLFGGGNSKGSQASSREKREEAAIAALPARSARAADLVDCLLSSSVQVQLPADSSEEPAKLSPEEVEKVFVEHVPGVREFLYREMYGEYSLEFMKGAYREGLQAFRDTDMHNHLLWLMRLIVHHGHEGGASAKRYLTEVAEAFMDCQAVQARVVERVGLEIRGVAPNFRGLVTSLVGDYKAMALKMLAAARLDMGFASDDDTPTHYENRLTADLGDLVGLNMDDIRRASLDEHAAARFRRLAKGPESDRAAKHFRALFDLDALVKAFVAEVNSFNPDSPPSCLARLFLDWASSRLKEKHIVFDEETCMSVEVSTPLAMAVIEDLFLGQNGAAADEIYRGQCLRELFRPSGEVAEEERPAETAGSENHAAGKHETPKEEEEMAADEKQEGEQEEEMVRAEKDRPQVKDAEHRSIEEAEDAQRGPPPIVEDVEATGAKKDVTSDASEGAAEAQRQGGFAAKELGGLQAGASSTPAPAAPAATPEGEAQLQSGQPPPPPESPPSPATLPPWALFAGAAGALAVAAALSRR